MLLGQRVKLVFVCDVCILELMKPLLLTTRVILLELLDLEAEGLILGDDLLLIGLVLACIFYDLFRGDSDVSLQFLALLFGVLQKLLVHKNILLQVIAHLYRV